MGDTRIVSMRWQRFSLNQVNLYCSPPPPSKKDPNTVDKVERVDLMQRSFSLQTVPCALPGRNPLEEAKLDQLAPVLAKAATRCLYMWRPCPTKMKKMWKKHVLRSESERYIRHVLSQPVTPCFSARRTRFSRIPSKLPAPFAGNGAQKTSSFHVKPKINTRGLFTVRELCSDCTHSNMLMCTKGVAQW